MHQEKLLREYVKKVLLEYEAAESYGYDGGGAYGMSFGSGEDLYNTFIGPFVDVFKTAAGKSKELGVKVRTAATVALQSTLTTLIPGYGYNYAEVFDKEKERLDKIKSEYSEVYEKTDKALASSDAGMLALMASPGLVLSKMAATTAAEKGPEAIKGTLSALTGGISDEVYEDIKQKAIDAGRWSLGEEEKTKEKRKKKSRKSDDDEDDDGLYAALSKYASKKKSDGKDPKDFFGENQINEDDSEDSVKKKADITPEKILKSKVFLKKAMESPRLKELQKVATETYRESLKQIYKQAEDILKKAKTVEDLQKMSKKPIKDIDKIKALQGEEKAKAEKVLLQNVRKAMKEFYVKNLNSQVESALRAGIPKEAQYIKDFKAVIQKIEAL